MGAVALDGTKEQLARRFRPCYVLGMAKLDPIISEFETEEAEASYDAWFRAQVEAGLADKGPGIPHEQVMREAKAIIAKYADAKSDLAA
jgi:predicted esterase